MASAELAYRIFPKPIDAGLILFNAPDAPHQFEKLAVFGLLEFRHAFSPEGSILPSLATASVTRFGTDPAEHPEFTPLHGVPGPDSGRIKFSHARHMARGLTMEQGGIPFTFASLEEPDRTRYGWARGRDGEPVQLRCDSCHRLDEGDPAGSPKGLAGPRSAGDAMLPVTYENDCRACHPLHFDAKDPKRQVRHGQTPSELFAELRQPYAAREIESDPSLLRRRPVRTRRGLRPIC